MIARVVAWSTRRPLVVLVVALLVAAGGAFARSRLTRDALPDLANPQIVLVSLLADPSDV